MKDRHQGKKEILHCKVVVSQIANHARAKNRDRMKKIRMEKKKA